MNRTRRIVVGAGLTAVAAAGAGGFLLWRRQAGTAEFEAEVAADYVAGRVTEVGGWVMSVTEAHQMRTSGQRVS